MSLNEATVREGGYVSPPPTNRPRTRFERFKSSIWTLTLAYVLVFAFVAFGGYYIGYTVNSYSTAWKRHSEEHKALNQIIEALNKEAAARRAAAEGAK